MAEGYVKFNCIWEQKEVRIQNEMFRELEKARSLLYKLGLIGVYPDGIGFGNISIRSGEGNSFIISGSATGRFAKLRPSHYALVTGYSISKNSVSCTGLTCASSESLSHAAVYEALPEVGAVVHVHCFWLWEKLLNKYPTTSPEVEYGTPEMAFAVGELASEIEEGNEKIIVMGGHREGIIAFGRTLNEARQELSKIYNQYQND